MTTISVALATYNGQRFLKQQLESLVGQSRQPDELVVSDDNSQDETVPILRQFARQAPFRVVILPPRERLGYRANFMRCVRHCSGEIIAFCDQDDVWLPRKLERQMEILASPDVLLSSHGVQLVDDEGAPTGGRFSLFPNEVESGCDGLPPFTFALGMTICMKRVCTTWDHLWERSIDWNATSERMAHDQWYSFIATVVGKLSFRDDVLANYRQHTTNASGVRVNRSRLGDILQKFRSRAEEYRRLERAAASCAAIIGTIANEADRVPTHGGDHLFAAQTAYLRLGQSLQRRAKIAESRQISQKLRYSYEAIRCGDYRPGSKWHFQPSSLVRDLLESYKLAG